MIQGFRRTAVWIAVLLMGVIIGGCGSREDSDVAVSGSLTNLTVNYEENPIGIEDTPVFGWRMQENAGNQAAYQIFVAESPEQLEQQEYVWDSGRTKSGLSVAVPYGGSALEAGKRYAWRVCAWDEDGNRMQGADTAFFEMGLTDGDWGALHGLASERTGKGKNRWRHSHTTSRMMCALAGHTPALCGGWTRTSMGTICALTSIRWVNRWNARLSNVPARTRTGLPSCSVRRFPTSLPARRRLAARSTMWSWMSRAAWSVPRWTALRFLWRSCQDSRRERNWQISDSGRREGHITRIMTILS